MIKFFDPKKEVREINTPHLRLVVSNLDPVPFKDPLPSSSKNSVLLFTRKLSSNICFQG